MINKLKTLMIATAVLLLGIVIYPYPPRINERVLLNKAIYAQKNVNYTAVQEHTIAWFSKDIRSTIRVKKDCQAISQDIRQEHLILQNYIPLVEGQDRIAGRSVWIMRLKPKLKHMPWKQIWIDKKTYIVLASRDWTAYNVIKRSMKTVSISFDNCKLTLPELSDPAMIPYCSIPKPSYMPHGFVLTDADKGTLVYSDGLYSISITTSHDTACLRNKALAWGQGMLYSTGRFTVIADLPKEEIERIARSITP